MTRTTVMKIRDDKVEGWVAGMVAWFSCT